MENASKALIMAASILLGLMVLSIAIVLFRSFSGSGAGIINQIEQTKIAEFNSQFYKYESQEEGITAYDILTMVNLAKENNEKYDVNQRSYGSYYIEINVNNNKFEKYSEKNLIDFLQDNETVYFVKKIELNSIGRVNYVEIKK